MGDLTTELPKPLLSVGGRPMLIHLLETLARAGLRSAEVVVGYRGETIEAVVEEASLGLELRFHRQQHLDGTAGALLLCREACGEEPFLLTWGDVLADVADYRTLIDRYSTGDCEHVIGVNAVGDPHAGAAVYVKADGLVERIVEKPPLGASKTRWNNAGVFVLASEVFDYAARVQLSSRGERELPSAMAAMLENGRRLAAQEIAGWRHLGTAEELDLARRSARTTLDTSS